MAEGADHSDEPNIFNTPVLQMGRGGMGLWQRSVSGAVGHGLDRKEVGFSPLVADSGRGTGLSCDLGGSPVGQSMEGEHLTSTPNSVDTAAISHLTDMVGQLGAQIGESIVAKLLSAGAVNLNSGVQSTTSPNTSVTHTSTDSHTATQTDSQVTVHVKSDKEPEFFRGAASDKYPVQDWIDIMKAYLRKQRCPVEEQAEEILGKLMGKAKDVVRVALRSDSSLNVRQKPELIYDMLMQYFSDSSSCLPLADFYSTLPKPGESPVDYWLRVNKAAELAADGLRRQGRGMENQSEEVARMFVKHCSDPELSSIFKCKPIQEWNTKDIQLRIDDYQREQRSSGKIRSDAQVKSHTATLLDMQHDAALYSQPLPGQSHAQYSTPHSRSPPPAAAVASPTYHMPCPPHITAQSQIYPPSQTHCPPMCSPTSAVFQNSQASEDSILNRMVAMMEQMMNTVQRRGGPPRGRGFQGGRREKACRVCNDSKHSTVTHCKSERLCFNCFAPGHTKAACNMPAPEPRPAGN
ncbi:uncharacterized protein LOC134449508 [Engraulis encrasicolus]|uniref:uncharacterized protein LOC134449508 n=1 Tax=Engraulis encrasicolus TaxID=184585 RepID=UPI002FCFD86D